MKPSGIIGIILILAMALSLSSCGLIVINYPGKDDPSATETTAPEETEIEDPGYDAVIRDYSAEAIKRLDAIESVDYNGAVVKIASAMPVLSDPDNAPEIVSPAVKKRNAMVEEKYNISIVTASVDNAELFAELSASKKSGMYYADLVTVPQDSLVSYIASGLLFNIRSMPKTDLSADYFNQYAVEAAAAGYGNYAVAGEATCSPYSLPAVFFSIDRLNELGLPLPYEKAENGEWTWDEFYKYLADVGETYTPFCTGNAGDFAIDYSYYSVGGKFMNAGALKYPTVQMNEEESAPLIEKITRAFTDEAYLIGDAGGVGVFEDSAVFMIDTLDSLYTLSDSEMKWGILPMPKMDAEQETYISLASPNAPFFAVPSVLNSDDRTSLVLRSLFAASYGSIGEAFIQYTQNSMLRDNDSANMLELVLSDIRYDFAFTVNSMYAEAASATSYLLRNTVFGTAELGQALRNAVPRCESSLAAAFEMK